MAKLNLFNKLLNAGPLLLLYFLSISDIDTNLEKTFEIFTFNLPIIIIYFWILKRPIIMGTGHIFLAGLINDVVMGYPLGISSLSYLYSYSSGKYSSFGFFVPLAVKIACELSASSDTGILLFKSVKSRTREDK